MSSASHEFGFSAFSGARDLVAPLWRKGHSRRSTSWVSREPRAGVTEGTRERATTDTIAEKRETPLAFQLAEYAGHMVGATITFALVIVALIALLRFTTFVETYLPWPTPSFVSIFFDGITYVLAAVYFLMFVSLVIRYTRTTLQKVECHYDADEAVQWQRPGKPSK